MKVSTPLNDRTNFDFYFKSCFKVGFHYSRLFTLLRHRQHLVFVVSVIEINRCYFNATGLLHLTRYFGLQRIDSLMFGSARAQLHTHPNIFRISNLNNDITTRRSIHVLHQIYFFCFLSTRCLLWLQVTTSFVHSGPINYVGYVSSQSKL